MTDKAAILNVLKALDLTMEATFVQWSQSRSKDDRENDFSGKPTKRPRYSLNWKVSIRRHGREFLATDYSAGSGHAPAGKAFPFHGRKVWQEETIARECETGVEHGHQFETQNNAQRRVVDGKSVPARIVPDACDVFSSIVMDSDVLDAGGFEEWASNFGYDTDSRKAESIYRACLDHALKLRAAVGDEGLRLLREAFQDY